MASHAQVYYVYGFALLVTLILLIVVVCVSIVGEHSVGAALAPVTVSGHIAI